MVFVNSIHLSCFLLFNATGEKKTKMYGVHARVYLAANNFYYVIEYISV